MAQEIPPIVLFGYDSSPFTQKIRLILRLLRLPYTFILVPSMMPRPLLLSAFALTYRKIPVLAIGRDLYIDTSLILEVLSTDARLINRYSAEVYPDQATRTLTRLLSSHYTDRPLFRLTTGLIPSVVWRTHFGTDRANLIGHKLDADKLDAKVPRNLAGLDTFLSILEPLFQERRWFLGTEKPGAADVALFYQLDWGERISRGEGIENLTGGGTRDGIGEGMSAVFNAERYPKLTEWFERFKSHVDAIESLEKRIEQDDLVSTEKAIKELDEYDVGTGVPMLKTPKNRIGALEHRVGLKIGATVSVAPDDTGRSSPTIGTLVAISTQEVVITPENPSLISKQDPKETRVKGVRLHFPRVGFVILPVNRARL